MTPEESILKFQALATQALIDSDMDKLLLVPASILANYLIDHLAALSMLQEDTGAALRQMALNPPTSTEGFKQ